MQSWDLNFEKIKDLSHNFQEGQGGNLPPHNDGIVSFQAEVPEQLQNAMNKMTAYPSINSFSKSNHIEIDSEIKMNSFIKFPTAQPYFSTW